MTSLSGLSFEDMIRRERAAFVRAWNLEVPAKGHPVRLVIYGGELVDDRTASQARYNGEPDEQPTIVLERAGVVSLARVVPVCVLAFPGGEP